MVEAAGFPPRQGVEVEVQASNEQLGECLMPSSPQRQSGCPRGVPNEGKRPWREGIGRTVELELIELRTPLPLPSSSSLEVDVG